MKRSRLNRKTPLKANKGLNKRSKKTQGRYRNERVPFVKRILEERPICEICEKNQSVDVHEIKSRARTGGVHGEAWLDESNVMALCRSCHIKVTDNPLWAEQCGYSA